jgi:hypothetical protein
MYFIIFLTVLKTLLALVNPLVYQKYLLMEIQLLKSSTINRLYCDTCNNSNSWTWNGLRSVHFRKIIKILLFCLILPILTHSSLYELYSTAITVKPVLCDLPREHWNMSNLSYVTFQGNIEIWSHKTGGL